MVELHVTSLDVIHSFWAYQLGVKADANPGVDNIAFVKPTKDQTFEVRCAELCGIWHGYMFDHGHVVSQARLRNLDPTNSRGSSRRRRRSCRHTARPTSPNPRGAPNEHCGRRTAPPADMPRRPLWRRLIGFNLLTAVLLGVGGYYLGWFIGHHDRRQKLRIPVKRSTRTTSRCCSPTSSAWSAS